MQKSAHLGRRVMVLDEGANWKGSGTALFIAEQGCEVILVTPAAAAMAEMARTMPTSSCACACAPSAPAS